MNYAIVGLGCISPFGLNPRENLSFLLETIDPADRCENALERFSLKDFIKSTKSYLDPASKYLLAAGSYAYFQAEFSETSKSETGVIVGVNSAGIDSGHKYWERYAQKNVASPLFFIHSFINTPASLLAIEYKLSGTNNTIMSNSDAGIEALFWALDAIEGGQAQAVLAGSIYKCHPSFQENASNTELFNATALAIESMEGAADRGKSPLAFLEPVWDYEAGLDGKGIKNLEEVCDRHEIKLQDCIIWSNFPDEAMLPSISLLPQLTNFKVPGDMLLCMAVDYFSSQDGPPSVRPQKMLVLNWNNDTNHQLFILTGATL